MTGPNHPQRQPRRRVAGAAEFLVALDPRGAEPLFRQIYQALRSAVLDGRLTPGQRVPSSRVLAAELGVGRNTVTLAFEQLQLEGYLESRRGGGTRVRAVRPTARAAGGTAAEPPRRRAPPVRLSARGAALATAGVAIGSRSGSDPVPFQLGVPAFDEFPARIWERLERARWRAGGVQLGEGDPAGDPALRVAIAEYVVSARGARCSVDQVIVTSGTQQSLDLASRLLLDPGDAAWIEDPAYPGAIATLRASGADIVPVPVDADGLDVAAGERRRPRARMAYVTPSHQFPLGVVMSASRRLALLAWARRANAWIFEDDYDSEFRYGGRPLPCLQGLDAESAAGGDTRVLYAGTFNKTLAHGLRVGYLVVPDGLADPLRAARVATTGQPPALLQGVLADFIGEGHYARHLRRLRGIYEERQRALLEGTEELLGGRLRLEPDGAGLHLVGRLASGADDVAVAKAARRAGVEVYPLSSFAVDRTVRREPGLLLGYAPFDRIAIRRGLRRLRGVL